MDKNSDGRITVEEFINVFMSANNILNDKIGKMDGTIKDYQR